MPSIFLSCGLNIDTFLFNRQGSVLADYELIFTEEVEDPLAPLEKVAKDGKLGNMTFEIEKSDGR